jgi:hypothetical protein
LTSRFERGENGFVGWLIITSTSSRKQMAKLGGSPQVVNWKPSTSRQ